MRLTLACALAALMLPAAVQAQTPRNTAPHLTDPAAAVEADARADAALMAAIQAGTRDAANVARDRYRHPYEALAFWGLRPGLTVVEIEPGAGGWWTEILAPYAQATGGRYVAAWIDTANPQTSERARTARTGLEAELAPLGAAAVDFGPQSGLAVEDGSADLILVARAFHNWHRAGLTDRYMGEFFRALKPGGVLAVEQHRAAEGADPDVSAPTGYVSQAHVIEAAARAGFVLDAESEINANAEDDRDHPFGVWTLPPIRRAEQDGRTLTVEERAAFDAVGESDRMTLRFRKPL